MHPESSYDILKKAAKPVKQRLYSLSIFNYIDVAQKLISSPSFRSLDEEPALII